MVVKSDKINVGEQSTNSSKILLRVDLVDRKRGGFSAAGLART
jgi:hypothetical protein